MPKVLIITDKSARHLYFCDQIINKIQYSTDVILGAKKSNRTNFEKLKRNLRTSPAQFFVNRLLNVCFLKYGKRLNQEKLQSEKFYFGLPHEYAHQNQINHPLLDLTKSSDDINSESTSSLIESGDYDVIAVMGSAIINKKIIDSAPYVLNLHTGLSPYYRGGNSNCWPIIEGDHDCLGVTIHKMSTGIDSGPIIFTDKIQINNRDTYPDINCRAIIVGTARMVKAIELAIEGRLNDKRQWTTGKVFYNRQWNNLRAFQYFSKLDGYISNSLGPQSDNNREKYQTVSNGVFRDR